MDTSKAKELLKAILGEVTHPDGRAATEKFASLRDVDAKIREAKVVLREVQVSGKPMTEQMDGDDDFTANSRRVRLEALANYCKMALRFLESGVVKQTKEIFSAPDLRKLTSVLPNLDGAIRNRWLEAQKCQHTNCYLSAVIMMGSVLEALLLARVSLSPADAYQSHRAPKDKNGQQLAFHEWNLNTLIDVSVDVGWLKTDRGKFSHALRESRNVVHPWNEVSSRANFDEATCKTCWHVLNASVDDLLGSI